MNLNIDDDNSNYYDKIISTGNIVVMASHHISFMAFSLGRMTTVNRCRGYHISNFLHYFYFHIKTPREIFMLRDSQ